TWAVTLSNDKASGSQPDQAREGSRPSSRRPVLYRTSARIPRAEFTQDSSESSHSRNSAGVEGCRNSGLSQPEAAKALGVGSNGSRLAVVPAQKQRLRICQPGGLCHGWSGEELLRETYGITEPAMRSRLPGGRPGG